MLIFLLEPSITLDDLCITDNLVLPRANRSAGFDDLCSLLSTLGLRAASTFGDHYSSSACDALWTWCRSRADVNSWRTQIDYLAVSSDILGTASVVTDTGIQPLCLSDHRAILGHFTIACRPAMCKSNKKPRSLLGWRPATTLDCHAYQQKAVEVIRNGVEIDEIVGELHETARGVSYSSCSSRSSSFLPSGFTDESGLRAARRMHRNTLPGTLARRNACRWLKKLQRRRARLRNTDFLQKVTAIAKVPPSVPVELKLTTGHVTADREQWLSDVGVHGKLKYGDTQATSEKQMDWYRLLLEELEASSVHDSSVPVSGFPFFDLLQAQAPMPSSKMLGLDGNPGEMIFFLPIPATFYFCYFWMLLCRRFTDLSQLGPVSWRLVELIGLGKRKAISNGGDFRWIGSISCLQKWYMRAIRPSYQCMWKPSPVCSFGFLKGASTDHVVATLRQI